MGSFQQIVLGLICLVAAFLFGSYVNSHPFPPFGIQTQPEQNLADSSSSQGGAVESKIGNEELDQLIRRAAPINTMRSPLKKSFGVPQVNSDSIPNLAARQSPLDEELPPPSQLESSNPADSDPNRMGNQYPRKVVQHNLIPDFSQIAAEFKNTPIELPRLENEAKKRQRPIESNRPIAEQPTSSPSVVVNPATNLKSMANQFRANSSLKDNSLVDHLPRDRESPPAAVTSPETVLQTPSKKAWFTAEDFVPKLIESDSPRLPKPSSIPISQGSPEENLGRGKASSQPTDTDEIVRQSTGPIGTTPSPTWEQNVARKPDQHDYAIDHSAPPSPDSSPIQSVLEDTIQESAAGPGITGYRPVDPRTTESESTYAGTYQAPQVSVPPASDQLTNPRIGNRVRTLYPTIVDSTPQPVKREPAIRIPADSGIASESNGSHSAGSNEFREHTVVNGETLQSLSEKYFGRAEFYLDIYLANRFQMRNPVDIREGMTLKIPVTK